MLSVRAINKDEAKIILLDDEIYDRITDDTCPDKQSFVFPDCLYWGGYLGGKLISVFIIHDSEYGAMAHFQVLKDYRLKYARKLARMCLNQATRPLYAEFPSLYKPYMNFCKKLGFYEIKVKENSYLKNNHYYDLHIMRLD